jgi:uncharacterized membrane protein YdjX (TVP38/TMEM64 family)
MGDQNQERLSLQHPPYRPSKRRTIILSVVAVVVLAALVGAALVWGRPLIAFFTDAGRVAAFVRRWGAWAAVITIGLHVAQVIAAPISGVALDWVNGFLFGPLLGTLFSMIGLGIGSTLAMWLSRRFGRPLVERFVDPQLLDRLDGLVRRHGVLFIFLVFLFPFLPDDAVCFLAGLTPIPLAELVLLMLIGRLPGTFAANWLGANALELSPLQWGLMGAGLVIVGIVFWRFQDSIERGLLAFIDRIGESKERWRGRG